MLLSLLANGDVAMFVVVRNDGHNQCKEFRSIHRLRQTVPPLGWGTHAVMAGLIFLYNFFVGLGGFFSVMSFLCVYHR